MKLKPAYVAIGAGVIILVALVFLVIYSVNQKPDSSNNNTETKQVQINKTLSGKSSDEDKNDVLQAAVTLLNATGAPKDSDQFKDYMEKISSGEMKMPDDLKNKIRLVGDLAKQDKIDSTIFQTLVTFANFAKQSSDSDTIGPLYDNSTDAIVLDQEAGVAYVPVNIFVKSGTESNGFSMEFVYVDGEWKLSPYMTLDELRLALTYQGSQNSDGTSDKK